jgi:multiple antibiotic resistance protein
MISSILAFLAMLNPFALFLYLEPVRKDLSFKSFLIVLFKATLISFAICLVFFYSGTFIFEKFFHINFESFRIFGGIIIFSFAYFFIVKGQRALVIMKENLDDLASEIALPFMIGAGTISLSILLSQSIPGLLGSGALVLIFAINFGILALLTATRKGIEKKKFRKAFDKNMEILLRLNGFFIGAIGIDMILQGINNLFLI